MAGGNKNKSKLALIIAILIAIIFVSVLAIAFLLFNSNGYKLKKQLELGDKYLHEMQYEQAIAAFEDAIRIDPKCMEAYVGLADAYTDMGDDQRAEKVIEKALKISDKKTSSDEVSKLQKMQEKIEKRELKRLEEEAKKKLNTFVMEWDPSLLENPDMIEVQISIDGNYQTNETDNGYQYCDNDGNVIVDYAITGKGEKNDKIVISIYDPSVDMEVEWSTGADNWNNLAEVKVTQLRGDDEVKSWTLEDGELMIRSYTGIHFIGFGFENGEYVPYDVSWILENTPEWFEGPVG